MLLMLMEQHLIFKKYIETIRYNKDIEGVVVRFDDGHMIKIKCDDYLIRHRSKDAISKPRHICEAILNEVIDDIRAYVTDEDRNQINIIEKELWNLIGELSSEIENKYKDFYQRYNGDKKRFAIENIKLLDKIILNGIFSLWSGKHINQYVLQLFKDNVNQDKKWSEFLNQLKTDKKYILS